MRQLLCLVVSIGCSFVPASAYAEISSQNPNAIISIIGPDAFSVGKPGQALPQAFAVRLVDPQGQPIEGLTVDFFTNYSACLPLAPNCVDPPPEMWGHFADLSGESRLTTDADGYAVSSIYFGGTVAGTYDVAAYVSPYGTARNTQVLKTFPPSVAMFAIRQFSDPGLAPVPTGGLVAVWILAAVVALAALWALRAASPCHATIRRRRARRDESELLQKT